MSVIDIFMLDYIKDIELIFVGKYIIILGYLGVFDWIYMRVLMGRVKLVVCSFIEFICLE